MIPPHTILLFQRGQSFVVCCMHSQQPNFKTNMCNIIFQGNWQRRLQGTAVGNGDSAGGAVAAVGGAVLNRLDHLGTLHNLACTRHSTHTHTQAGGMHTCEGVHACRCSDADMCRGEEGCVMCTIWGRTMTVFSDTQHADIVWHTTHQTPRACRPACTAHSSSTTVKPRCQQAQV